MYLITSTQMRAIEDRAIKELMIPSLLLMENAAIATVKHIEGQKAVVICGPGNNGGDGLAIARLLHVKGMDVQAVFVGDMKSLTGDALVNLNIARKMGLLSDKGIENLLPSADTVIDALFGTGLRGPLAGEAAQVVEAINRCTARIVSVDIPSGVEADTGRVGSTAVRADTTITFGLAKVGLILYPGAEYAGEVVVEDISIPKDMLVPDGPAPEQLTAVSDQLPPRPDRSNKGTFGRVCVIAGSRDMPGAAVLCCKAAYKAGAGLVHACTAPEVAKTVQASAPEVITSDIADVKEAVSSADVVALGPGLGRGPDIYAFVREILESCKKPMVLDADALMAVAQDKSVLHKLQALCVITPHPGEMGALTGMSIPEVLDDLLGCASSFAQEYGVVTLLKDARTVIASPCGRMFINPTGTPALAKAGSGDVLTGVIAAFIAQGLDALTAAAAGAYVHGRAGQMAAKDLSLYGVVASDVIEYVAKILR